MRKQVVFPQIIYNTLFKFSITVAYIINVHVLTQVNSVV